MNLIPRGGDLSDPQATSNTGSSLPAGDMELSTAQLRVPMSIVASLPNTEAASAPPASITGAPTDIAQGDYRPVVQPNIAGTRNKECSLRRFRLPNGQLVPQRYKSDGKGAVVYEYTDQQILDWY